MRPRSHPPSGGRWATLGFLAAATVGAVITLASCARVGRLQYVAQTVSPAEAGSAESLRADEGREDEDGEQVPFRPLFGDTLIGFVSGTADSSRRHLGRLRDGYTVDTLNIMLFGDNRPGFRTSRLAPEFLKIKQLFSPNPIKIVRGLITLPVAFVKGMYPDLALIREIPAEIRRMPTWGREHQVLNAMIAKVDSLGAMGQTVAAVINTGDLVKDGQRPAHWERFLRLTHPLSSRVPYFPIAGNHERTDTENGVENWRAATGLPNGGDRLYYCFDSVDGWVRFIALDSNPMTDPADHWTREVEVKYSDEQIDWLVVRLKEHNGPAFVFMHHPSFSSGFHRAEWENSTMLRERRDRMVAAMHDAGLSILATGHEHDYQRALLTWPDAVPISIGTGGAGAPLHNIPAPALIAQLFSEYTVAGSVIKAENVLTGAFFHFIHVRLWYGGGEFYTYAVDKNAQTTLIDKVQIDLSRYGVPQIDQHKMPLPPKGTEVPPPKEESKDKANTAAKSDFVSASQRLQSEPPPAPKWPR